MFYHGKVLLLDTFREVLKGYSRDVQDVVRSAILDGVDISDYITGCKDNPYRLDQIRLGMNENLDEVLFKIPSGHQLYVLRGLNREGVSLKPIAAYCNSPLEDRYFDYMVGWVKDGIPFSSVNVNIIPNDLLSIFDKGLRSKCDMSLFQWGPSFSEAYISECLRMLANSRSVSVFLSGDWSVAALKYLNTFRFLPQDKWVTLLSHLSPFMDLEEVTLRARCFVAGLDLIKIREKGVELNRLRLFLEASEAGIDCSNLYDCHSLSDLKLAIESAKADKVVKVTGKLVKRQYGGL